MFVSAPELMPPAAPARAILEVVWQDDASARVLTRSNEGEVLGEERRVEIRELLQLQAAPPEELELGGTARATFAVLELARTSVAEGLVHPHLDSGDGWWYAFWGATLDATVQETLTRIAAALPRVAADAFEGDRESAVHDLYPVAVDQIARDRLRAAGVTLTETRRFGKPSAVELFLQGLTAPDQALPRHAGYPALERRLARWVDEGLTNLARTAWNLGLHLDEREAASGALVLELWLQAGDDPTLSLPASLLWEAGDGVFGFLRSGNPQRDLIRALEQIEPVLAEVGVELPDSEPTEVELDEETVSRFLREAMPRLAELGVPVLLPSAWLRTAPRLKVNLRATSGPVRSTGLFSPDDLARFDWRIAIGDTTLSDEELQRLAEAKEPFVRVGGRWQAVRRTDVERALRFLEQRRTGNGIVELVRAVSGVSVDEAGLELGEVSLDPALADLLGGSETRFRALPTPAGMALQLFPFQERGHGWLRMLGDLGIGAILADDMGLGKTVQAIAMLVSEREQHGDLGPTLVVCPMSVVKQWAAEIHRFAPGLRVHVQHGTLRPVGPDLREAVEASDVVVTSYDIATRDAEQLAALDWNRLILDEAQDVKNPQTKRARSLRLIRARRRVAMTGTPIENRLGELWAIMDIVNPGLLGSREWFDRTFARKIELWHDEAALERLRAIVHPFVLRRAKDDPEVELELPPITVEKDYCRLTVEQASLYQATVDRWLPRIEAHEDRFGRRGAVLAMLGQLKQVCNHPELILRTDAELVGRSGKLERLVELLRDVPAGEKSLVFTQYPGFDRLVPHLAERLGVEVGFFHGRLNARQREELLEAFAEEGGPQILVISIRAGGRGLNLPAANHVFHFDRWWNPAVEQQATDRAYRFGQRRHVHVHSLICTGTLEERIDQLLDSKRELAAKVIAGRSEDWLGDLDLGAIRAAVELSLEAVEEAA